MKSLFKTVFLIVVFSFITRLFGFIFRIWLSRTIGAEALGIYQVSFSIFMVLLTIVASGIPLIVSRQTAKQVMRKDKHTEHDIVSSSVIYSLILSVIISVIVLIFQNPISKIFADPRCIFILIALLPALIFSSVYSSVRGNLWGRNNYLATCSAELFEQIARIIICVILLCGLFPQISGDMGAAISMSIACILSCIFVVVWYIRVGGKFVKPTYIKEIAKTSTPITLMRVASSLIQPVIALVIPFRLVSAGYTNSQALSLYGIASGMTMPLLFIPMTVIGSLSYALVPDLAGASANKDENYIKSRITSSLNFSIFVSCLVIPIFIGAGENIGIFFFDNVTSGVLLSQSAWVILPLCLTNISSSILNSMGLELKSFKNYIVGAICMLLCIWFLPKYIGIQSLIWAMGSCFTISSILNIRMIKKQICNFSLKKYTLKSVLIIIPCIAFTSFMSGILNNFIPLFFNLVISCSIGAITYLVLGLVFNTYKITNVIIWFKNSKIFKVKKKKQA